MQDKNKKLVPLIACRSFILVIATKQKPCICPIVIYFPKPKISKISNVELDFDSSEEGEREEGVRAKYSNTDVELPDIIDIEGFSLSLNKMDKKKRLRSKKQRNKERNKTGKKRPKDFVKNPMFTKDDNCEIFKALESKAHEAINGKKIFTIIGGYDILRQSLVGRGWIEKLLDIEVNRCVVNEKLISQAGEDYDAKRMVLSHLVKSSPTYFIWQPKHFDGIPYNVNYPFRNRINRMRTFDFTVKEGLHNLAENIQWHIIEDLTELNYPRSYLLMDHYQREHFLNEFRRSLISCFLNYCNDYFDIIFSKNGPVSSELIFNSLHRMEQYIKIKQDFYIDSDKMSHNMTFAELTKDIHYVVHLDKKIRYPEYYDNVAMDKLKATIEATALEITANWPDSKYDGHNNIWILKPINRSRGIGVVLMRDVEKMFDHVIRHNENKYIVQKYVERPLLIYNTKFDIRQYFLTVVTKDCVNIWCYRDCYIKFSSQEFSLKDLHESVHLTNNSIQKYYPNGVRNEALPEHNMWLLKEFKKYLHQIGKKNQWEEKIYPKIKKNLLAIILASLEDTDLELNTFELNGADLLIGFDFEPILLEINATPDLNYTTKTTHDICPRVMEDLVKVIIDLQSDDFASTGDFELIYECHISRVSPMRNQKLQLNVDGKKILPPVKPPRKFFPFKNITDMVIKGEKMLNPLKTRYCRPQLVNFQHKRLVEDEEERQRRVKAIKKYGKPMKLYRPQSNRPRNIFRNIVVKPYSNEIVSYVKKLPSILQSTNRKFINLNDLMRYLKIE